MKKFIYGLFLIAIGVVIVSSLYALPPDDDFPPPPEGKDFFMGKMVMDVLDKLNLSKEQREKIKTIHEETREKTMVLRKDMRENMRILKDELSVYRSDEKSVREIMQKIKDIGGKLFETRVNTFIKMKEILTPGQFETFKQELGKKKEEKRKHCQKYRGKRSTEPPEIED